MPKKGKISPSQTNGFCVRTASKPNPGREIKLKQKTLPGEESGKKEGLLQMLPMSAIRHRDLPNNPVQGVIRPGNPWVGSYAPLLAVPINPGLAILQEDVSKSARLQEKPGIPTRSLAGIPEK